MTNITTPPDEMEGFLRGQATRQAQAAGYSNMNCRGAQSARLTYLKGVIDALYLTGYLPQERYDMVCMLAMVGREDEAFVTTERVMAEVRLERYGVKS